jgi:hypothetical protein
MMRIRNNIFIYLSLFLLLLFVCLTRKVLVVVQSFVISSEKIVSSTTLSPYPKVVTTCLLPYKHQLLHTTRQKHQSVTLFVSDINSQQQQQEQPTIGNTRLLPTLTSDTTWMVRITLRNIKTQFGQTISNQMYVLYGQFIPLENYEPPQGTFQQRFNINNNNNNNNDTITISTDPYNGNNNGIQITSSRWILSEDPNDRKDGLWIWGLFQQPLYPFMLLSFETKPIPIINKSSNSNDQDYISALQLYVQLDHTCNRDTGAVSFNKRQPQQTLLNTKDDSVTTGSTNYELMIRQVETISADPLSLSKVDIYEEVSIGTISIQPYK